MECDEDTKEHCKKKKIVGERNYTKSTKHLWYKHYVSFIITTDISENTDWSLTSGSF